MINSKRIVAVLFILFNIASFAPNIYRSYIKISKLEKEIATIKEAQCSIKEKIQMYDNEIEDLKDIDNKEKIVRNKLQMVKNGEIIYRVIK